MSGDIEAKVSAFVNSLSPEEQREAVQYLEVFIATVKGPPPSDRLRIGSKSYNDASGGRLMRVIAPPFDLREIVAASASDLLRSLAELRTSIRRRWSLRRELQLVSAHLALRIAIRLLRGSLRSGRNRGSDFVPLTSAGPRFPWTKDELAALEGFGKPVPVIPNAGQPLLRAGAQGSRNRAASVPSRLIVSSYSESRASHFLRFLRHEE